MQGLMRHIEAAHGATAGSRLPFRLGADLVGWVTPAAASQLDAFGYGLCLEDPAALAGLTERLASCGALSLRGEMFDVRAVPEGPVLATIDRGALPWFGMAAEGVHLNGLVRRPDGLHLWVARRAMDRKLDPGRLDHLVAGGIPAGLTPAETLVKEAAEEAGMAEALARQAGRVSIIAYAMERPEGLRRDRLHCFDLYLPEDFIPMPRDGEVAGFELWPIGRVLRTVADTDDFKFNVNLVLIDLFLRAGVVDANGPEGLALRQALSARAFGATSV